MSGSGASDWRDGGGVAPDIERPTVSTDDQGFEDEELEAEEPRFFEDPKRLAQTALFVVVVVVGIYFLVPQIAGFDDGLEKLGEGNRLWLAAAFASAASSGRACT